MMLDRDAVFTKVRAALAEVLEDADREVRPQDHMVEDLGFDSVNMASLTIALEEEFGEVLLLNDWIADASSPTDLTVGSLVDYLVGLLRDAG